MQLEFELTTMLQSGPLATTPQGNPPYLLNDICIFSLDTLIPVLSFSLSFNFLIQVI